jgi:predicted MFS family arabinose efflux permease
VSVGAISSSIIGMAMFGGLLTVPLYLQIVKGSTATQAGLQLIPFVVGIMAGSITAGQLIARTGRYRIFPIIGSALMLAALLIFYRIGADTPLWQTMLVMVLMGLGLGGNMQPVITAVQNAVSPREIGVSTSSVTFFRSMGGTLGAAVFLSILFSTVGGQIKNALQAASGQPGFAEAAAAHPELRQVSSAGSSALSDTSFIGRLPEILAHPFKVGFSDAMSMVFLFAAGIMLIGLIVISFLPELPLRSQSAVQARLSEENAPVA